MLSLEQVKLLETKVANTIEYVQRITGENAALRKKLETNQKRIDELEVLVTRFKEEQSRIEDGILAALDRLNQFEDAIEKSLALHNKETSADKAGKAPASGVSANKTPPAQNDADGVEAAPLEPVVSMEPEEKAESGELDIF